MNLSNHNIEKLVLGMKGRDWLRLGPKQQSRIIEQGYRYWRSRGFPYYKLDRAEMLAEYVRLSETSKDKIIMGNMIQMSMVGLNLANSFHPQMWTVRVKGSKSPMETFNNDQKLAGAIEKALTIWPDRFSINESNMRRMLKTYSNTAGVSNFRPTVAKAIYEYFSSNRDSILDFSAGFGGRLLGCLTLKRKYTGIDPCRHQIRGLSCMIKTLDSLTPINASAKIIHGCAEDIMPQMDSSSFSFID